MTPGEFFAKWFKNDPTMTDASAAAIYADLRRLVEGYVVLAERGARADAYTVAAKIVDERPNDEAYMFTGLSTLLRGRAENALKGGL